MKLSIGICLATYNGEKYLAEQLDSLLNQSHQNFIIYVHDDNSSDNTVNIVKEYVSKFPSKFVFFDDDISYRDAGINFLEILKRSNNHDFYMFCDQDDIWLEDKISNTLNKILLENSNTEQYPILCHTDLVIVDDSLSKINQSFIASSNIDPYENNYYNYVVLGNNATGCTMMFNNSARKIILSKEYPSHTKKMMHDYWAVLSVSKIPSAKILFLPEQTMLYRQHGSNTIGFKRKTIKRTSLPLARALIATLDPLFIFKALKRIKQVNKYYPSRISFWQYLSIRFKNKYKTYQRK
ncbi:glycosyltransferase family 2 protein [Pseudofrancisella aestuarii]|uniref:Glycosyltransferase family 2 protein n=1 Tax=Pseudofrancisella aestuarii TaxID=2670347 RepID=A0ABV9TAE4_9GAMM|nr:glycosyltransferase family 2 protein [Pseudofrancisella aestuarii]